MLLNMTITEVTLGYWSTKGLGSVSRMLILYAGVKLIAKIYKLLPKLMHQHLFSIVPYTYS